MPVWTFLLPVLYRRHPLPPSFSVSVRLPSRQSARDLVSRKLRSSVTCRHRASICMPHKWTVSKQDWKALEQIRGLKPQLKILSGFSSSSHLSQLAMKSILVVCVVWCCLRFCQGQLDFQITRRPGLPDQFSNPQCDQRWCRQRQSYSSNCICGCFQLYSTFVMQNASAFGCMGNTATRTQLAGK